MILDVLWFFDNKIYLLLWWRVEGGIVVTVLHSVAGTDGGTL
jgi:hypothetical protein